MIKQKFLMLVASAVLLTAMPLAPRSVAQSTATPGAVAEILQQLNLTPEQQTKVDKIQALAAVQIKGILTPEQVKQLKVMTDSGKGDTESFNALKLTEDQKTKLNDVKMDVAMQLLPVLSSEQQKKLFDAVTARAKKQ